MSFRIWLSIVTVALLALILFLARHELHAAWLLLGQVDLLILLLMVPVQLLVLYAGGEMIFSYLRDKGQVKKVSKWEMIRISFEGNFVNHVLPSGGVSGVSYLTWRLSHLGVSPGRATMAQVVRHASTFTAFALLLLIALFAVTLDGDLNRWIILTSASLFGLIAGGVLACIYLLSSKRRIEKFAVWMYRALNYVTRRVTFGRKRKLVKQEVISEFLDDMHHDFVELRHDKKLLIKPYLWGIVFNIADAGLFMVAFWSLGEIFNPAPILIAYGVASLVGFVVATPGGAGVYEAIMVTVLAFAGISGGVAIAGILLARVVILIITIVFGYVFYQHALSTYGGPKNAAKTHG